jgi:hypothetical protein
MMTRLLKSPKDLEKMMIVNGKERDKPFFFLADSGKGSSPSRFDLKQTH